MFEEQATPKKRWRPRFSLLALLLGVVFVGACGGLWWRWEPWYFDLPASHRISAQPPASFEAGEWPSRMASDRKRYVACIDGTMRSYPDYEQELFCFFTGERMPGIPRGFLDDDTFLFDATDIESDDAELPYIVYSRRRPEYWWGIAWLPEFWIALVSGTALLYLGCCRFSRRFQTSE